jgi:hypothetical protein
MLISRQYQHYDRVTLAQFGCDSCPRRATTRLSDSEWMAMPSGRQRVAYPRDWHRRDGRDLCDECVSRRLDAIADEMLAIASLSL